MISSEVFKASRDEARFKLSPEEARDSFGYYIDIANDWESYRTPEDLVPWLGIHSTHVAQYQELIHNLGELSEEELNWVQRYVQFYDSASRMLTTTGKRANLCYDLAETLTDWRTILRYVDLPANILDFGAGCARQGVSAFLRDVRSRYTAIDSTLAAYTAQNLVFSCMDLISPTPKTRDFLDFQLATKPYPDIAKAEEGSCFHVPVWMAEEKIPERYYDVIIAAHVHNELSSYDFMRLINCVDKGLNDEGIFYVRSEFFVIDPRDFFDAVDLHAMGIVKILRDRGFVPVFCKFHTYLTTVFARVGSSYHKKAKRSDALETQFMDITENRAVSELACKHFTERRFNEISNSGGKIGIIGGGNSFYDDYVAPRLGTFGSHKHYLDDAVLGADSEQTAKELVAFDPDILIIPSHNCGALETAVKAMFPDDHFMLRQHYFYPIVFLYKENFSRRDKIFERDIKTPADLGLDPETLLPTGIFV